MKTTITNTQTRNAVNYADTKELTRALSVVVSTDHTFCELITVRWYTGRARHASVVYCSVWICGNNLYISGSGKAGGGGYDKYSAAFAEALTSAGVELSENIAGVGTSAIERALADLALEIGGYKNLLFVRH